MKTSSIGKNVKSLFIGRWQPFHSGHKKLIEEVLKEGKSVVIGIRDTGIDEANPHSVIERMNMIKNIMKEWGDKVEVWPIPNIVEVCHGRKVGWIIREIRLDEKTEKISATSIRKKFYKEL